MIHSWKWIKKESCPVCGRNFLITTRWSINRGKLFFRTKIHELTSRIRRGGLRAQKAISSQKYLKLFLKFGFSSISFRARIWQNFYPHSTLVYTHWTERCSSCGQTGWIMPHDFLLRNVLHGKPPTIDSTGKTLLQDPLWCEVQVSIGGLTTGYFFTLR